MGGGSAGHERATAAGAALSLAVGRAAELRRFPACGDRGPARRARSSIWPIAAPRRRGDGQLDLLRDLGPDRIVREVAVVGRPRHRPASPQQPMLPHLIMPGASRCARRATSSCAACTAALAAAAERGPADFAELLLVPGRRRAHGAGARHGRRSRPRRALPLLRSGAVLARSWRQGPPSLSGADQGL